MGLECAARFRTKANAARSVVCSWSPTAMRNTRLLLAVIATGALASPNRAQEPSRAQDSAAPPTVAAAPPATAPAPTADVATATAAAEKAPPAEVAAQPETGTLNERVRLEFRGQGWLPALEWLARQLNLNLDWQTIPEGEFNLSSSKEYTVEEAQDLINMQLLARGFTLLQRGEVLRVAPLKDLDITLVPRVSAEELATLPRHQFVRVSFMLDWMIAEDAAKEFKPLLSPFGQLFAMASSNRIEAMDAVVNLRELDRLLSRAESDEGRRERVAEFRLEHRPAEEVAAKVRKLLGLPAEGTPEVPGVQTQLDIEKTKFHLEAVKQLGASAQPLLNEKPEVFLVVNEKENSILVNARPDKMEIARQAIEAMDKPLPPAESSWESLNRVKVYEVSGFNPATVSQILASLQERGNMAKETRIQHEPAYNRIIAVASPEDQVTIANLIDSFRTQGRKAEVLSLATVDARYAAKAVQLVLKNPIRPSSAPGVASDGQFQIEPDVQNKRLLLWATPAEVTEVRDFLVQLGETFQSADANSQMHVVNLGGVNVAELTPLLKQAWSEISDAPLVIETQADPTTAPPPTETPESSEQSAMPPTGRTVANPPPIRLVAQQQVVGQPAAPQEPAAAPPAPEDAQAVAPATAAPPIAAPAAAAPPATEHPVTGQPAQAPVRIIEGDDGEVVIISKDPAAANAARQFLQHMVPDPGQVQVVQLKHSQASIVKAQLDIALAHTLADTTSTLSTEQPLKIDTDVRTNRLLIQHATPRQTRLINQIVPALDQPEQEDQRLAREQRIYRVQYKRVTEVAEVIKEVYRDLLSTSDKAFANLNLNQPIGYNRAVAASNRSPEYQGLLAIGIDAEANTLVISAPNYLIEEVMELVKSVDVKTAGSTIAVVSVKSAATNAKLKETLTRMLAPQP